MDFRKITIPYQGRAKYGNTSDGDAIARSIIKNYFGGGSSSTGGGNGGNTNGGSDNRGDNATSFFAYFDKPSGAFSALEFMERPVKDTVRVFGYKAMDTAQVLIGDLGQSGATENYGILGYPIPGSGVSVTVSGNGTTAATIYIEIDSTLPSDIVQGELRFPVNVNVNSNNLDPYHEVWYNNRSWIQTTYLSYTFTISRVGSTSYSLELSNERAGVNVSARTADDFDVLYPNSIAALTCEATTWLGTQEVNATYSATTDERFSAIGYGITTGGTMWWNNSFSFKGPSLPINIIASVDNVPIATKTMTIEKNYPGAEGQAAVTRWIVTSHDVVKYNPNDNTISPSAVTGYVMKQVGDDEPIYDSATTIYHWYDEREDLKTHKQGLISAETFAVSSSMTFALKNSNDVWYEIETVPTMRDGINGESGATGAKGDSGESAWYLSLSDDNSSINADHEGNIYENAVRPSTTATLRYGTKTDTGATIQITVKDSGVTISDPSTYGISKNGMTISTGPNFHFSASTLVISVTGYDKNGVERDTKVWNITKSYAGASGSSIEVQWSVNGVSGWHNDYREGDLYMRMKENGEWGPAIRVVGESESGSSYYQDFKFIFSGDTPQKPNELVVNHYFADADYTAFTGGTGWSREGLVLTHTGTAAGTANIRVSKNTTKPFLVRVWTDGGVCNLYRAGTSTASTELVSSVHNYETIYYQAATGNTTLTFYGVGNVKVEIGSENTTMPNEWNDAPIATTANTISYAASGSWSKSGGYYVSPASQAEMKGWEKIDFTTLDDNQYLAISGKVSSEVGYDGILISNVDANFGGISGTTFRDATAEDFLGRYSGEFEFAKSIKIPTKGNHTIYIGYLKDGSEDKGQDKGWFKICDQDIMWMSSAEVKDGAVGEWSDPIRFGEIPFHPAVTYWVENNFDSVLFDRIESSVTPNVITATAYRQVGDASAVRADDCDIKFKWYTRGSLDPSSEYNYADYQSGVTITPASAIAYCKLRFMIYKDNEQKDYEDVDILTDGTAGQQGRQGAAIRGPYDYSAISGQTRWWCNGEHSASYAESEKWIDVIIKDDAYYYCKTTYQGPLAPWNTYGSNWQAGDKFDFVATNLLLAKNAKINFLSNNELYLMDGDDVTGGAAGGSGITFWAGQSSPATAPFRVNASGSVTATTGEIGGWKYDQHGLSWAYYDGVENLNDASLNAGGVSFSYEGAGMHESFFAGLGGVHYSTENMGEVGLDLEGDRMKIILSDGINTVPSNIVSGGINTNMDIYGWTNTGVRTLDNGLSVKTPAYVEGAMVSTKHSGVTGNLLSYSTAVVSPFAGLKIAAITTGSTYSTYFTKVLVDGYYYWHFNNDLNLKILATGTNSYPYMLQMTSAAVVSNWRGIGYPGIPSEWIGMWCACSTNGISSSYFYVPTGIYGPNHTRKGDTIYFDV